MHPDLLLRLKNLAATYRRMGRDEDAVPLLEQAVPVAEAGYGTEDPEVADLLGLLGNAFFRLGRFEEAQRVEVRALEIVQAQDGDIRTCCCG